MQATIALEYPTSMPNAEASLGPIKRSFKMINPEGWLLGQKQGRLSSPRVYGGGHALRPSEVK